MVPLFSAIEKHNKEFVKKTDIGLPVFSVRIKVAVWTDD